MLENLSSEFANNKGADHPGHLRSLISDTVIHSLESYIYKLATSKISTYLTVSVAEQACFSMTWSVLLNVGFLATRQYLTST